MFDDIPIDQQRRRLLGALPLTAVALGSSLALPNPAWSQAAMSALETSLEKSRTDKKGVTLLVGGTTVALVVTEVFDGFVIGRSQQYDRIVVNLEKIDGVLG